MSQRRSIAIIGLGRFGSSMGRALTAMGDEVLGIDIRPDCVSSLAADIDSVVQLDATDPLALAECGLPDFETVVVCIGDDIESSLLTCMAARDCGCKSLWVKVQSVMHRRILEHMGVDHLIAPESDAGRELAQRLHNPSLVNQMILEEDLLIAQLLVPEVLFEAPFSKLSLDAALTAMGVLRNSSWLSLEAEGECFQSGDSLLLHGPRSLLRTFSSVS